MRPKLNKCQPDQGEGDNGAGAAIKGTAAFDIQVARRSFATVADPGAVQRLSMIDAWAGKGDIQCARHGAFRPAGVGRGVQAMVPAHDAPGTARPGIRRDQCAQTYEQTRQAGARPVGDVVKAGRELAEIQIALATMADHGVHGVDGFVGQQARQAAQQEPEQGRDHAVGKILGQGFQRGAGHPGLVQFGGVPPDNMTHGFPSRRQTPFQATCHGGHVVVQTAGGEKNGTNHAQNKPAVSRLIGQPGNDVAGEYADADHDGDQVDTAYGLLLGIRPWIAQPAFQFVDQGAHPDNGMGQTAIQPFRVAKQQIQHIGQGHGQKAEFPAIAAGNGK